MKSEEMKSEEIQSEIYKTIKMIVRAELEKFAEQLEKNSNNSANRIVKLLKESGYH